VNEINPLANITTTEFSKVSSEFFLVDSIKTEKDLFSLDKLSSNSGHQHFYEKESIESIVIRTNVTSKDNLDSKIGHLIWDESIKYGFSIIRFKGVLYSDSGLLYSIQGLYDLYEISEVKKSEDSLEGISRLLLIGKRLRENKDLIENLLN